MSNFDLKYFVGSSSFQALNGRAYTNNRTSVQILLSFFKSNVQIDFGYQYRNISIDISFLANLIPTPKAAGFSISMSLRFIYGFKSDTDKSCCAKNSIILG